MKLSPVFRGALGVLGLAAAVRLVNYAQVKDGAIPYYHWWGQSDMSFFDSWAREIAAGNLAGVPAPRPYHRWHGEVAQEVHRLRGVTEPYSEAWGRALWNRWLGDRAFYQDPLYPYLLAGVYRFWGEAPGPPLILHALLGLGTAVLLFVLGRQLWDSTVGWVAGALAALYAPFVFYESALLRPTLHVFLLAVMATCAVRALQGPGRRRGFWAAAGLAGALAMLTHSSSAVFVVALGAVLWRSARRDWTLLRRCAIGYLGGLLIGLSPLMARNLAAGLPPWPWSISGGGALNFILSQAADYNPHGAFQVSSFTGPILASTDGKLLAVVRETLATHSGVSSWLAQSGRKVLGLFHWQETTDNLNFYYFLLHSPWLARIGLRFSLIAPLAVLGLALWWRRPWYAAVPALIVASMVVVNLVFFPSSRNRVPAVTGLIPFAAFGLVEGIRRLRSGPRVSLIGPLLAAGATAVLVAGPWWPVPAPIRDLDYAVGNGIAHLRMNAAATPATQLRILEAQLKTEPDGLRRVEPTGARSVISGFDASLAGSFAELHALAATVARQVGDTSRATAHARRAQVLGEIARQYAARPSRPAGDRDPSRPGTPPP